MGCFCLFQIGPVQEFIQTARKTQDYWAGSFLLSYLNARAIQAFGAKEVIFPHVDGNPLYRAATQNPSRCWDLSGLNKVDPFRPSLPNRFFAVTPSDPESKLKAAEQAVWEIWQRIAENVRDYFFKSFLTSGRSKGSKNLSPASAAARLPSFSCPPRWDDQIAFRSFEILYVWRQLMNANHNDGYRNVEEWMGARKASRIFDPLAPQEGHVCSLCGLRTAIYPDGCRSRKEVRDWWETSVRGSQQNRYRFRDGEYLCAVCIVKRLAPHVVFQMPSGEVPSTSTMAVVSYHKDCLELLSKVRSTDQSFERNLLDALHDHKIQCRKAGRKIEEPVKTGWPRYLDLRFKGYARYRFFMDGDWFIEDFYNHSRRRYDTQEALKALKKLKEEFSQAADKVALRLVPPSKYLVLLTADGDSMGELLSTIQTEAHHRALSKLLVDFSTQRAPQVLEEQIPGRILYWGGDEGVAMLPLQDLPTALPALREAWANFVEKPLSGSVPSKPLTLSVGAVIFHHQYPLRSAIRQAFQTLEKAKDRPGKNSWAVRILRRSGAPVETVGPWEEKIPGGSNNFKPLELLSLLIKEQSEGRLSPRWLADLERERTALGDVNLAIVTDEDERQELWQNSSDLFNREIGRIIGRHWDKNSATGTRDTIIEGLKCLNTIVSGIPPQMNMSRYAEILAFLDLAHYIAKGGGQ